MGAYVVCMGKLQGSPQQHSYNVQRQVYAQGRDMVRNKINYVGIGELWPDNYV